MKTLLRRLVEADTTAGKGELVAAKMISEELGVSGIDSTIDSWGRNRGNQKSKGKSDTDSTFAFFFAGAAENPKLRWTRVVDYLLKDG